MRELPSSSRKIVDELLQGVRPTHFDEADAPLGFRGRLEEPAFDGRVVSQNQTIDRTPCQARDSLTRLRQTPPRIEGIVDLRGGRVVYSRKHI
jgi:hypothetical protein